MANPLLLLVVFSGFFITLSDAWNVAARMNLVIHPLLGLFFTAHMLWYGSGRVRRLAPRFSRLFWIFLPTGLSIYLTIPGVALPEASRFFAFLAILVGYFSAGAVRLFYLAPQPVRLPAVVNYVGLSVWMLTLFCGLTALTVGLEEGLPFVFTSHRSIAIIFVGVLLLQWGLDLFQQRFHPHVPTAPAPGSPRLRRFTIGAGVTITLLAATYGYEQTHQDPEFTAYLSTMPIEARQPGERRLYPSPGTFNAAALTLTDTCVDSCHTEIAKGFFESNHNIAFATPHMQKVHGLMTRETGEHNAGICFGCHAPVALFDRSLNREALQRHDNFSCTFCHSIRRVDDGRGDQRLPSYTVAPAERHTSLFMAYGQEQSLGWLDSAAIRMNPLGHKRAFSSEFRDSDGMCVACHGRQLDRIPQRHLNRPRCIDCHMQPLSELGGDSEEKNHFFPGGNVTVPKLAGRPEAASIIEAWMSGRYPPSFRGWENRGWDELAPAATRETRGYGSSERNGSRRFRPRRSVLLAMALRGRPLPVPGEEAELEIVTTNAGIGHNFPATALDLADVWLQIEISDRNGRVIRSIGEPRADGAVSETAPRLGGEILSAEDGRPIEAHRVWIESEAVVWRLLAEGEHTTDRIAFTVPGDAEGPLKVRARWNYRNYKRDFFQWAYGSETSGPPILTVGSLRAEIPLASN